MKVLMINVVCGIRSTGRICTDLATALEAQGHEVKIAYGRETVPEQFKKYAVRIGNDWDVRLHALKARLFDASGFGSTFVTKRFIKWVKEYDPDIIHLHNIHGYYLNVKILFEYLKTCGKKVIWTLHDCWSFTGHCCFFDFVKCYKWKTGCNSCKQKHNYPQRIGFDHSCNNYAIKQKLFTGIRNLTIVTPSKWLADLVSESFLCEYPMMVIQNGIDSKTFHPVSTSIKEKYGILDKKMILGVASVWDKRKGLDDFIELSKLLDNTYVIVLVGLSKHQISRLPDNVIGIEHTNNSMELAELYSAADVFVNPTYEDNYPTTNVEAISCGTPVITYQTGGSPESALLFGDVVKKRTALDIFASLLKLNDFKNKAKDMDCLIMVKRYMELYDGRA